MVSKQERKTILTSPHNRASSLVYFLAKFIHNLLSPITRFYLATEHVTDKIINAFRSLSMESQEQKSKNFVEGSELNFPVTVDIKVFVMYESSLSIPRLQKPN